MTCLPNTAVQIHVLTCLSSGSEVWESENKKEERCCFSSLNRAPPSEPSKEASTESVSSEQQGDVGWNPADGAVAPSCSVCAWVWLLVQTLQGFSSFCMKLEEWCLKGKVGINLPEIAYVSLVFIKKKRSLWAVIWFVRRLSWRQNTCECNLFVSLISGWMY